MKEFREVRGGEDVKGFKSEHQDLEIDPVLTREPMELDEGSVMWSVDFVQVTKAQRGYCCQDVDIQILCIYQSS